MIETPERPQKDLEMRTTAPSDNEPSEKIPWYDRLPEFLAIIVMVVVIGELIYKAAQHDWAR